MRKDRLDWAATLDKLKPRRGPYWQRVAGVGRSIGYRKMTAHSSGVWLARMSTAPGRYVETSLGEFLDVPKKDRYEAAVKGANEWFAHLGQGGAVVSGTVEDACRSYLEKLKGEGQDHGDAEGRFVRLVWGGPRKVGGGPEKVKSYERDRIASLQLSKLTKADVSGWRKRVLAVSKSNSTFNRNASALRAALNYAKEEGTVTTDQAWLKALKAIEGKTPRRDIYLDLAQRRALIENADEPLRPFLELLRMVPLRPGEAAALRVSDFDARRSQLTIAGGKTRGRTITLGSNAVTFLKQCAASKLPSAWLIANASGDRWTTETWCEGVQIARAAAHLPRKTVAYTLRHSVITDLVMGGLDIFTVAKLAGTSVKMIEEHYGHLSHAHSRMALDSIAL